MDMLSYIMGAKSGGGGLPTPTASDAGSTMTVQAVPVDGAVIAPEQTVEYDVEADRYNALTDVDLSLYVEGATVKLTIGNKAGVGELTDNGGYLEVGFEDDEYGIWKDPELPVLYVWDNIADGNPITVKCNLVSYSYQWVVTPSGLISYTEDQGAVTLNKTYNELVSIVNSGTNPWLVRQVSEEGVVSHYIYRLIGLYYVSGETTGAVFYCNIPNADNPYLAFEGQDPDGSLVLTN